MRRNGYFYHFSEVIWMFARDDGADFQSVLSMRKLGETEGFRNGNGMNGQPPLPYGPPLGKRGNLLLPEY